MKHNLHFKHSLAIAVLAIFMLAPGLGWGQLLVEDFNYPIGTVLTTTATADPTTGWLSHSGNGTQNIDVTAGLSFSGYAGSGIGGAANVDNNGQDINKTFSSQTSGTVYAAFMLQTQSTNSAGYFFMFSPAPVSSTFFSRIYVNSTGSGVGISGSSAPASYVSITAGVPVFIVVKHDFSTHVSSLFVLNTFSATEPGTADRTYTETATAIAAVALRQYNAAEKVIVDGIRVGMTWADVTPSSVVATPTKLVVTSVNGNGSPVSGVPFSVTVQAQDESNIPQPVTSDVNVTLSGTGIGGTITGTILNGQNSATISGVTMSEGTGLTITATQTSGTPTLTAGTSSAFYVMSTTPNYRTLTSGNWSTAGTWEIQISGNWYNAAEYPNASNKNATILNGHTVAVTDNAGACNNLTVDNGGKVWVGSTAAKFLYAYGNITCDGTIGDAGGTDGLGFDIEGTNCLISGSGLFNISRMAKYTETNLVTNLTIGMSVSVMYTHATNSALYNFKPLTTTFNITINANAGLAVPNAKIDLNACTLTLKSDASLIDNGTISGQSGTNVTIERSIAGGNWHLISSPVSGATAEMFLGKYLQNHDEYFNSFSDIFDINVALTPMKGFGVYSPTTFTAQYTGTLNTGAQTIGLTRTATVNPGWNLVGNPYPSSIDWNASTGWTKTNVNGTIYLHVNNATWATWNGSTGTNGGTQYIALGQGFFVEVTNGFTSGTLASDNLVRVHNATTFFKNSVSNLVRLQVSGNTYTDEAVVMFSPDATAEFDGNYDAHKLFGEVAEAAQLYSLGSTPLAINVLPETNIVPMGMKVGAEGVYTIAATEVNDIASVSLEDTKTGIFTDLMNGSYSFNYTPGENEQRFVLHFNSLSINEMENSFANVYGNANTVYVDLKNNVKGDIFVYTVAGQLVASVPAAQGSNKINLENTGNYIVKVISDKSTMVSKIFIQ